LRQETWRGECDSEHYDEGVSGHVVCTRVRWPFDRCAPRRARPATSSLYHLGGHLTNPRSRAPVR